MIRLMKFLITSTTIFIVACSTQTLPYEKITKHYIYQIADENSDPNFYTNIYSSIKSMTPFFKQFYDLGVQDKKQNISHEAYEKRIAELSSDNFINNIKSRTFYISEKIHAEEKKVKDKPNKEKKIMIESIIAAYNAGYAK